MLSRVAQRLAAIPLLVGCAPVCMSAVGAGAGVQEPAPPQPGRFLAFEHREGIRATPSAACLEGYVQRSHPLYARYRLLVLQHTESASPPDVQRISRCLGTDWVPVPLEQTRSMLRVLTDEILVRFKEAAQPKDIEALLRANDLTTDGRPPNNLRLLTARTNRPSAESLQIAKKLLTSALVEYAEPNKIVVRLDR